MAEIVLSTLNAKYPHASFGLRYLMANLGDLRERAKILEFDINQRPLDIVEQILDEKPAIVGMGIYIWNVEQSERVVADLKRLRQDLIIVLGGPEVSYEIDQQSITAMANYVIAGEADLAFADLCRGLLRGKRPLMKIIPAEPPEFSQLKLPYELYDARDVASRVIYVEASRGCPFKCEFCLSSLDVPLRNVPLDEFLEQMQKLLDRGVNQFKFVDRTFNLNLKIGREILEFFHQRYRPGLFLHFEMIPDRLPEGLRESIKKFPPAALQFEVGIQTFNDEVAGLISRRQDNARVEDNFRFLREETGVHIHADLIVGLPGEDMESFGRGFDRLLAMRPQEIQVGILKRLRGTPIVRHDAEWKMAYSPSAPYEILQTSLVDFPTMQRLRRFSRYWDMIANSGNFKNTLPLIWGEDSPFRMFLRLGDWLFARTRQTHAIALQNLSELLFQFLTMEVREDPLCAAKAIWSDYQRAGRSDRPKFLAPYSSHLHFRERTKSLTGSSRQARHLS